MLRFMGRKESDTTVRLNLAELIEGHLDCFRLWASLSFKVNTLTLFLPVLG